MIATKPNPAVLASHYLAARRRRTVRKQEAVWLGVRRRLAVDALQKRMTDRQRQELTADARRLIAAHQAAIEVCEKEDARFALAEEILDHAARIELSARHEEVTEIVALEERAVQFEVEADKDPQGLFARRGKLASEVSAKREVFTL